MKDFTLHGMSRRGRFILFGLLVAGMLALSASGAQASCAIPPHDGEWINENENTRGITKARIHTYCYDVITPDMPVPPGPPGAIQLFGSCSPTDCPWPSVSWYDSALGWKIAFVDHGFARRTIHFRYYPPQMWDNNADYPRLRIIVDTDFVDPNRRDYRMDEWFRRAPTMGDPLPAPPPGGGSGSPRP